MQKTHRYFVRLNISEEIEVLKSTHKRQSRLLEHRLTSIRLAYSEKVETLDAFYGNLKEVVKQCFEKALTTKSSLQIKRLAYRIEEKHEEFVAKVEAFRNLAKNVFAEELTFIHRARVSGEPWHVNAWNLLESKLMPTLKSGKSWDPIATLEQWRESLEPGMQKTLIEAEKLVNESKKELLSHYDDAFVVEQIEKQVQVMRLQLRAEILVNSNLASIIHKSIESHAQERDATKIKFASVALTIRVISQLL